MFNKAIKKVFRAAGLNVERRDRLMESIPADYNQSPFLPRIYRGNVQRLMYFRDMLEEVRAVPGDIVECGVSIGHGALFFLLLSEWLGVNRGYWGFDSFEGFPEPVAKDEKTPIRGPGFWASPPEIVHRVLRDGRVPENVVRDQVRLVRGWFNETVSRYEGQIALLHLDCDLYQSYKLCLETFYPKVASGGVIMFDEYQDSRWPGATKAIDEFFADKPEKVVPHRLCDWKYHTVKL